MKSYAEWCMLADRWRSCVDYGSPVTAWWPVMFILRDRVHASQSLADQLRLSLIWGKYRSMDGDLMKLDKELYLTIEKDCV